MTDEQKQRLSEHLATKVCGWRLEGDTYTMPNGGTWRAHNWTPLDDARHTEVVMLAWVKDGLELKLRNCLNGQWECVADCLKHARATDWREAVCEAIGGASGWEG